MIQSCGSNSIFQILRSPATSLLQYSKEDVTSTTTVCSLWQLPAHVSVYSCISPSPSMLHPTTSPPRVDDSQRYNTLTRFTNTLVHIHSSVGIVYIHHRTSTIIHTSGLNPSLPLSFYHSRHSAENVLSQW